MMHRQDRDMVGLGQPLEWAKRVVIALVLCAAPRIGARGHLRPGVDHQEPRVRMGLEIVFQTGEPTFGQTRPLQRKVQAVWDFRHGDQQLASARLQAARVLFQGQVEYLAPGYWMFAECDPTGCDGKCQREREPAFAQFGFARQQGQPLRQGLWDRPAYCWQFPGEQVTQAENCRSGPRCWRRGHGRPLSLLKTYGLRLLQGFLEGNAKGCAVLCVEVTRIFRFGEAHHKYFAWPMPLRKPLQQM